MGLRKQKGLRITDATAQPINVEDGLVFYNNDGRQVGERTQGEILEKVIPSGTPLIEDGANYNHMIIQNVASFDASASASLTQGAIIYAGIKAAALQYKSSTSVAMLRKHSFDTNIVIADIREFTFKVGDNSFNLSFGKDYFGLTKNVYAQLANSKGSSVPISPNDNYSFLMLNIEKGVIKKVSIGINTYRAETQTNVEIAFKINTVARSIIDATAVPSDVASGKTFYNNDGKQVGSNNSALKEYRFKIKTGEYNATRESFKWSTKGAWNLSHQIVNYDRPYDSQYIYINTEDSYETMPAFFTLDVSNLKIERIYGIRYQPPLYKEPIDFICKYSPISLPQGGMQIYFSEGVRCRYMDDSTYESYVDFEILSICLTKNIIKMFTTVSGGFSVQKVVPDKDMDFVLYYK